jgi:hypothetical protein
MEDAAPVPNPHLMGLIDGYATRWGLSDADVARRIAITPHTLQEWRSHGVRRLPDRPVLEAIAAALAMEYQRVLQICLTDTGYLSTPSGHSAPSVENVMQLGAYADSLPAHKLPAFQIPSVHLEPSHSPGSHVMRARAYLHLVDVDAPGAAVIGGYADFLLISLDGAPAPDSAETVTATSVYAPLFPGDVLRPGLIDDAEAVRWGLLVEDVFIDSAFRGNWLAAFLVATIAHRIAGQTGPGLIAICPHTADLVLHTNRDDDAEDLSQRSRDYWQDHLRMTATDDGFLVVSTSSDAFAAAVDEHKVVNDVFICLDREQLLLRRRNNDRKLWPASSNPLPANHTQPADSGGSAQATSVTPYFGERHFTELNRIIAGVQHLDDMTYTSVTAVISFVGPDPADQQQSDVFARAAHYLAEHPEIAVSSTHWRDFTDERGAAMYALDIEVIPPSWRDALLR